MKKIILIMLAGIMVACSQDPLSGMPDDVRNPVNPGKKPGQDLDPIREDLLYLDIKESSSIKFTEGFSGIIQFDARVLTEEPTPFALEIENLPLGAVFDTTKLEMKWEVPKGFISGGRPVLDYSLEVSLYTLSEPIQVKKKEFLLRVSKNFNKPEIVSVVRKESRLLEGEQGSITVTVRDESSNLETPPELILIAPSRKSSGASLVKSSDGTLIDVATGTWEYKIQVFSGNIEIVEDTEYEFNFMAISNVGIKSDPENTTIQVINKVGEPELISDDDVRVFRNQRSVVQFTIVAPDSNGRLDLNWSQCLGQVGIVDCNCNTSKNLGSCTVVVEPDVDISEYNLKIDSVNSNRSLSRDVEKSSFEVTLTVEDATSSVEERKHAK